MRRRRVCATLNSDGVRGQPSDRGSRLKTATPCERERVVRYTAREVLRPCLPCQTPLPSLGPRIRRALALSSLVFLLCEMWAHGARAQGPADPLALCLERAIQAARGQGAKVARRLSPTFLLAPEAKHVTFAVPEASCVGFLAVGRRQVQGLRLSLYDEGGDLLAKSDGQTAYAYVSTCAVAGSNVVAHVQVLEGGGGVEILPLINAPAELPGLSDAMTQCPGVGLPGPPPFDVGPDPMGPSLGQRLTRLTVSLRERGYVPLGTSLSGVLGAMRRDLRRLPLPAGHCLALAVIQDSDMEDVDVRLFADGAQLALIDRDLGRGQPALVKVCSSEAAVFVLDIRSYEYGGRYLLQPYWLVPPTPRRDPIGLSARMRIELWEMQWRLSRVGMWVEETQWIQLPTRDEYRAPLQLAGGQCHAVGLLGEAEGIPRDVDLCVTDVEGNVMGNDSGPGIAPLVYLCPQFDAGFGAQLRAPDTDRPIRALLVISGDRPAGAPMMAPVK